MLRPPPLATIAAILSNPRRLSSVQRRGGTRWRSPASDCFLFFTPSCHDPRIELTGEHHYLPVVDVFFLFRDEALGKVSPQPGPGPDGKPRARKRESDQSREHWTRQQQQDQQLPRRLTGLVVIDGVHRLKTPDASGVRFAHGVLGSAARWTEIEWMRRVRAAVSGERLCKGSGTGDRSKRGIYVWEQAPLPFPRLSCELWFWGRRSELATQRQATHRACLLSGYLERTRALLLVQPCSPVPRLTV